MEPKEEDDDEKMPVAEDKPERGFAKMFSMKVGRSVRGGYYFCLLLCVVISRHMPPSPPHGCHCSHDFVPGPRLLCSVVQSRKSGKDKSAKDKGKSTRSRAGGSDADYNRSRKTVGGDHAASEPDEDSIYEVRGGGCAFSPSSLPLLSLFSPSSLTLLSLFSPSSPPLLSLFSPSPSTSCRRSFACACPPPERAFFTLVDVLPGVVW